ncbi:MAG TPA: NADP-dependent oxidoreductase [Streptosporangiaceae bacterium]|jgi:NADPH:quinone reductase-like Zn-dependent oxidoreductase
MQVIAVSEFGGPEVLRPGQAPVPQPGPGEVLVRVLAAGVGPWDASLRRGDLGGSLPFVPGGEFAGVVEGDTGADAGLHEGSPVSGYPGLTGCYAQYVSCPVEQLAPIPAGLSMVDAAAAPINALTAEEGLTDVLGVSPGDRVLITAGAGGLGHLAVQIARILGASVVATASPQHHEFVHKLGAATVVDHTKPDWPGQVRELTGGGAEKVLVCAAPTLAGAARAARDGALIATPVGGEVPGTDRVRWQRYDGQPRGSRLIRMAPWFDDGSLTVTLQARYSWHDAAEAHRVVERGHTRGKLVLVVDDDLAASLGI